MGKITVSILGSKIAADAVEYKNREFQTIMRVVDLSPFSYTGYRGKSGNTNIFHTNNEYKNNLAEMDLGKNVLEDIDRKQDIIVVDMLAARCILYEFVMQDGTVFRITWDETTQNNLENIRAYVTENIGTIAAERKRNPLTFSDAEIDMEIHNYCEHLCSEIHETKIVLLEVHNIYQYFDMRERFAILPSVELVNQYNCFYDKCVSCFKKYCSCLTISKPDYLYGNEKVKPANMFHFNKTYYSYITSCLCSIRDSEYSTKVSAELLEQCNVKSKLELEELMLKSLVDLSFHKRNGRKIVLIGDSAVYEYMLKRKYGLGIYKRVKCDESTTEEELSKQLCDIAGQNNEYLCIVPRLYSNVQTLRILWKNGFGYEKGYYCVNHVGISLVSFKGSYADFYGNSVRSKVPITIMMNGCGNLVVIGEGGISPQSQITVLHQSAIHIEDHVRSGDTGISARVYDGAMVSIAEGVYVGDGTHIRGSYFSQTVIGKDTIIDSNTILFNGDGHAIFNLHTGNNINYDILNSKEEKHRILIGEHVYVGRHCFILSGSVISDHSYVEDESLVNKVFENKKIVLAGSPAREIRNE